MEKESFPGLFDTSSAGHIPAGDDPVTSALREPVEIDKLSLQKSEVDEVRWFDLEEVWEEIKISRERFCVPTDGLKILRKYLLIV